MTSTRWGRTATKVLQERNQEQEGWKTSGRKPLYAGDRQDVVQMGSQGFTGDATKIQLLLAELKACGKARNLERGKQIHEEALDCGHDASIYVVNALISMYAKCGRMVDARQLFDNLNHPTVVSWNALILGYADNEQGHTALDLFARMSHAPDSLTFVAALKACTSLAVKRGASGWDECRNRCKDMHQLVVKNGFISHIYVQSTLVDMYTKCGNMADARQVFDNLKHPTIVSWNALILGYADNEQGYTALKLFTRMRTEGPTPDSVTFVAALKACSSLAVKEGCRNLGTVIHNLAIENGCSSHIYVQCTLIDMYTKYGSMEDARQVFDSLKHPTVVSWNALILGYANNGQGQTALYLFSRMKSQGPAPDSVSFIAAIKACTTLAVKDGPSSWTKYRDMGRGIQERAAEAGCSLDIYVQSTLVDLYAKCGSMSDAHHVFDIMELPNVVSWNALILGYADNGQALTALTLFTRMSTEGPAPDSVTFAIVLKACALLGALEFGKAIHSKIKNDLDVVLVTCLVDLYAKCGSLAEAKSVFELHAEKRNMITWNALLAGFSSCGNDEAVFELFEGMQDAGFRPDGVTFLCMLTCCNHAGLVDKGKECFDSMSMNYGIDPSVEHYNCMVDILGRANKLEDAMALLKRMPCSPNDVTWMTILGACRKWRNVEIGRVAFHCLTRFDGIDAAGYLLMGQIYKSRDMLQEQDMVMEMREMLKAR